MPGGKKRDRDERSQIAHSAGPFKGSEAYTDSCQSALMTPRLLTGDTVHPPHTPMMHLSTHLPFYRSFSLSPCFRCFTTFSLASYQWSSSPWLWRVSARTAFVSYHRPALLIRPPPPLYAQGFSVSLCLLSACFYDSAADQNRSFIGRFCPCSAVCLYTER